MSKHIDAVTGTEFETEEDYLNFVNPVTGYTARDIEHQDALTNGRASRIGEKARARGEARKQVAPSGPSQGGGSAI